MRADFAPYGVDVLLAVAGFGVLLALGLRPRSVPATVGAIGLAYMVGLALIPVLLTVLLVIGIPFGIVTFLLLVIACLAAGGWRVYRSGPPPPRNDPPARRSWREWRSWPADTWVIAAFVVVFAAFALIGMLDFARSPLIEWDGWTIWMRKARVLTEHGSLWHGYWTNPVYDISHRDYPLQISIFEALHGRAAGELDSAHVLGYLWLTVVGFVWAAAYLMHAFGKVRPLVWAPVLLLVATAPAVLEQVTGDADLLMAFFACLGAAAMAFWLRDGDRRLLALAAIFLAATANTKNEGAAFVVALLVVAFVIVLVRRLDWRSYVAAGIGVVAFGIAPWRLWISAHGIEPEIQIGQGLHPGYLWDRIDRLGPTIDAINGQLADQSRWAYVLPIAAVLVAFALFSGLGRRVAAYYLGTFVLVWAVFVWNYWISPIELSWYLATSVTRVVSVPIFICVAAVLHLSGIFVGALDGAGRGSPSDAEAGRPGSTHDGGGREQREDSSVA
jgi:hypothetical protein